LWLLRQIWGQPRPPQTESTTAIARAGQLINHMITARKERDYAQAVACEVDAQAAVNELPECPRKWRLQVRLWRDGAEWRRQRAAGLPLGVERGQLLEAAERYLVLAANRYSKAYAPISRAGNADRGASLGMRARLLVTEGDVDGARAELRRVKRHLFWGNNPHYRLYHGLDYNELELYASSKPSWQLWRLWPSLLANLVRSVRYGQQQPRLHTVRALGHIVLALLPASYRRLLMQGELPPQNIWLVLLPEAIRPKVLAGTPLIRSLPELAPEPASPTRPDHTEAT
jgi:hypothetical protein